MSDNDDFLNDDLIETADDTYNINIEDEDLLLADDDEFNKTTPEIKKTVLPDITPKEKKTTTPVVTKTSLVRSNNLQQKNVQKEVISKVEIKETVTKTPVVNVQSKESVVSKVPEMIRKEIVQETKPIELKTNVVQKQNVQQNKPITPVVIQKTSLPETKLLESKSNVVIQKPNVQQNKPITPVVIQKTILSETQPIVSKPNVQQNKPITPVVIQKTCLPETEPIVSKANVVIQKPNVQQNKPITPVVIQKTCLPETQPIVSKTNVVIQKPNVQQNKPIESKTPIVIQKANIQENKPIESKPPVVIQKQNLQQTKPVINKTPIVIRPEQLLPKETPKPIAGKTPIVIRSDQLLPKENNPNIVSPKKIGLNQSKEISSNSVQEAPSSEISTDQISSTEKTPHPDSVDGIDDNDRVSSSIDVEKPKYRDEQNERFPTERQGDTKICDTIPDSLDNVPVDTKFEGKQFGNRKNFRNDNRSPQKGFRGRRDFGGSRPPFREEGRPFREDGGNYDRGPNFYPRFNDRSDFGPRNEFRSMPPGRFDSDSLKFTISNPPPNLFMGSRGPNDLPPKKVLINPHFKGPGYSGQDFSRSQFLDDRLHLFPPPNIGMDSFGGRRLLDLAQGPVSEEALGKLAEQFINEQQRCLQYKMSNKDDDFFEKTKRFIENTSIEKPLERKEDPELEMLRQKQEQFIKSNINNLYKRREPPPPPRSLRSPPRRPRPAKSFRSRSPSPVQKPNASTAEDNETADGEDGEYKAKMREQAEMRARILQAKERRRKRDAETLKQKLDELLEKEEEDEKRQQAQRQNEASIGTVSQNSDSNTKETKPKNEDDILMHMDEFLDDDALQLLPEAEDLLLTDPEDDILTEKKVKHKAPKIVILGSSKGQPPQATVKPKPIVFNAKTEAKPAKTEARPAPTRTETEKPNLKRVADNSGKQDLRSKISKPMEAVVPTQAVQPRKKIVYGDAISEKDSAKTATENTNLDSNPTATLAQKKRDNKSGNRGPTIAARVISDVLQTASNVNKRTVLPIKSSSAVPEPDKKPDSDSAASDRGIFGRRRIVVNRTASNRVVLPRKPQQPLVIIENEDADEEDQVPEKVARGERSLKAVVSGLPPGMTEARLLSLCGPEVERVDIEGGTAEAHFTSGEACTRFVRRFNGKMVSAHCLQVRQA